MEEIRNWLRSSGLEVYFQKFIDQGWERFEDLKTISDKDLEACIPLAGHRQRFQNEMRSQRHVYGTILTPWTSIGSDTMSAINTSKIPNDETNKEHDAIESMSW